MVNFQLLYTNLPLSIPNPKVWSVFIKLNENNTPHKSSIGTTHIVTTDLNPLMIKTLNFVIKR